MPENSVMTLFSSSGGNCVYIKSGGSEYLIDAGVSAKCIEKSLCDIGSTLGNIKAIFVTHEHSDHIKGLETISKYHGIPIYAPPLCCAALCRSPYVAPYVSPLEDGVPVKVENAVFTPFKTPHDSASSCGYVVDLGVKKIGLATDMGYITKKTAEYLTGCEGVIIESNHDVEMLKNGVYPYQLKQRILGNYGHLSNESCASFLPYLVKSGTRYIVLAHLSAENNTPSLAYDEAVNMLEANGITVCGGSVCGDVYLAVAPRDSRCVLCEF